MLSRPQRRIVAPSPLGELRGQTPASASRGPEAAVGNDDRFSGEAVVSAAPPSRLEQQSGVRGRIGD